MEKYLLKSTADRDLVDIQLDNCLDAALEQALPAHPAS
jgi:hypothetical protein